MKKTYQKPTALSIAMHLDTLIAQSPTIGFGSGEQDAEKAMSQERDFFEHSWGEEE